MRVAVTIKEHVSDAVLPEFHLGWWPWYNQQFQFSLFLAEFSSDFFEGEGGVTFVSGLFGVGDFRAVPGTLKHECNGAIDDDTDTSSLCRFFVVLPSIHAGPLQH